MNHDPLIQNFEEWIKKNFVEKFHNEKIFEKFSCTLRYKNKRFVKEMIKLHLSKSHHFTNEKVNNIINKRRDFEQTIEEGITRKNTIFF